MAVKPTLAEARAASKVVRPAKARPAKPELAHLGAPEGRFVGSPGAVRSVDERVARGLSLIRETVQTRVEADVDAALADAHARVALLTSYRQAPQATREWLADFLKLGNR